MKHLIENFSVRMLLFIVLLLVSAEIRSNEPLDRLNAHLRGGEFAAARQIATTLPADQRDEALAQVTQAQLRGGTPVAAAATLREISNPSSRESATSGYSSIALNRQTPYVNGGPVVSSGGGQGGGGFADFDSLMTLIQQTISPDTWEALGGPSTMAPYPQGIMVDASGTVREIDTLAPQDRLLDLGNLLRANAQSRSFGEIAKPNEWRLPSEMRVVSLRRMRDEIARRQLVGMQLSDSLIYFAGISEISHIVLMDDDVLIAGVVGGITSYQGWLVDNATGMHPLRLDFFNTAARSAFNQQPFGCTIDPSLEGLAKAQQVAADVQNDRLPIGAAAEKLGEALGKQRVEVFGTEGDTTIGFLMVEADRHMKRLTLGEVEMPDGVSNYLDFINQMIAQGPPAEVLIRLWFTSNPQKVQADTQRQVFRLSGRPLRLSGQNERKVDEVRRRVADDPRTVALVNEFNQRFDLIRAKYPIYGAVESLYRVAAFAELMNQFAVEGSSRELVQSISQFELFAASERAGQMLRAPTSVDSIAVLHSVRHRSKRHHVLLASGGVFVDSDHAIDSKVDTYATLANDLTQFKSRPTVVDRWWWDAKESSEYPASR
jgi:Protein of unknown function (DUF1598)